MSVRVAEGIGDIPIDSAGRVIEVNQNGSICKIVVVLRYQNPMCGMADHKHEFTCRQFNRHFAIIGVPASP